VTPVSHEFFFSYASVNLDKELRAFFELLCEEVAPYTPWGKDDPRISFRDGKDLPLMEEWKPALLEALQTSAVMVCVTSAAYFQSSFCGQEYYIFNQRRRQGLAPGAPMPRVVLPVLWAPVDADLPIFDDIQVKAPGISPEIWQVYSKKGLRYLKKFDPNEYEKMVAAFAEAIHAAAKQHPDIKPLAKVEPFEQIPNAFAGGVWEEAADPGGWAPGPGVANVVFAAAIGNELQQPAGRYGSMAAEWRPFLPPEPRTIAEIVRTAAKKNGLRYREIPVDKQLATELQGARDRKNLSLVLADPQSLQIAKYGPVATFDSQTWVGTALLMLWDDLAGPWEDATLQTIVTKTFPIRAQLKAPSYQAPVRSAAELETILDTTFADLRNALTKAETEKKERLFEPPAQVSAAGAAT
jgi:hypothetical protein